MSKRIAISEKKGQSTKMLKRTLVIGLLIVSGYSVTNAAESQWYWISVPSNPMTGYFTEGPNTIGKTADTRETRTSTSAGYSVIAAVRTLLPDNFMEVMELTYGSKNCSEKLEIALSKLRKYDSTNEIVSSFKSSVWINEESSSGREKLLTRIVNDAEQCLEEEEEKEESEEEEVVAKIDVNRADLLKQIQSLLELIIQLKAQLAIKQLQ